MYDLEGQQVNKTLSGGAAGFSTIFENAAETSAEGVELEVFGSPTDQFRFSAAVSYLHSRYDDFLTKDPLDPRNVSGGVPAGDPATDFVPPGGVPDVQLAGNPTRNSPDWAWNLHGEYDLGGEMLGGLFTLMGDVSYKDDVYFTEFKRLLEGPGELHGPGHAASLCIGRRAMDRRALGQEPDRRRSRIEHVSARHGSRHWRHLHAAANLRAHIGLPVLTGPAAGS